MARFDTTSVDMHLMHLYLGAEIILSIHISLSNLLVLWVYCRTRSVRTVTNTYIFSLALTDFLAGAFGIPATVYSVLTRRPSSFYGCLFVHLILCILCTISTFHMLAIALDKYFTICRDNQILKSRRTRAVFLIGFSWLAGTGIAILPLFNAFDFASTEANFQNECHFTVVVDYRYLVYVIFFATILAPSAVIVFCYVSIHQRIRSEEMQVKCLLGHSERQRRMNGRRKLIRILLILVLTYAICWYPLYIMNTMTFMLPSWMHPSANQQLCAVVLSHLSCALNPIIYAYGMPGFKKALRCFFRLGPAECRGGPNNTTMGGCSAAYGGRSTLVNPSPGASASGKQPSLSLRARRKISAPLPAVKRSIQHSVHLGGHHHHHRGSAGTNQTGPLAPLGTLVGPLNGPAILRIGDHRRGTIQL